MKLSDYVLKWVKQHTDDIFTLSGGGIIHLINSLPDSGINYYCFQHEQSIAIAMEGYAKLNRGVGFGLITTGPGSVNTLTGLVGSWLDGVPTFFISGQVPTTQSAKGSGRRQYGEQEVDIISMVKDITKYSVEITNPTYIRYTLEKSFYEATTGKPGPVWISIPLDIQSADINPDELDGYFIPNNKYNILSVETITTISKQLKESVKPILIVGDGIRTEDEIASLRIFIHNTQIPVMSGTHHGIDMLDSGYKYNVGRFGIYGNKHSNKLIQEADLLLIVGSPMSVRIMGYDPDKFAPDAEIIWVNNNSEDFHNNLSPCRLCVCDLSWFLDEMFHKTVEYINRWRQHCLEEKKKYPLIIDKFINRPDGYLSSYYFADCLVKNTPDDIPIVVSNGTAFLCTIPYIPILNGRRVFGNSCCGSMGYGLPAAIGACFANGKRPTICVEGDGSIHMNIQELQTVKHYNLPLKIFIINNKGYNSIRQTQNNLFNGKYVASSEDTGVSLPDYRRIANAYDINYLSASSNIEIKDAIEYTMLCQGPVICEVFVSPNEVNEPKVTTVLKNDKFIPGSLDQTKYEDE